MNKKEAYELGMKLAFRLPNLSGLRETASQWFDKQMTERVQPWLLKQVEKNLKEMAESLEKDPRQREFLEKFLD